MYRWKTLYDWRDSTVVVILERMKKKTISIPCFQYNVHLIFLINQVPLLHKAKDLLPFHPVRPEQILNGVFLVAKLETAGSEA